VNGKEISFSQTRAQTVPDFTYSMKGKVLSITGLKLGNQSFTEDIEKVLRKIEHYHQGSIASFRILYRDSDGMGGELSRDQERQERKNRLSKPKFEGGLSTRFIRTNCFNSARD
jgi:hypothetical protein